jgi:hypothetical protein
LNNHTPYKPYTPNGIEEWIVYPNGDSGHSYGTLFFMLPILTKKI